MRGLAPRIHAFSLSRRGDADGRHKAGHDDQASLSCLTAAIAERSYVFDLPLFPEACRR
jgi:hypothetical protein